MAIGADGKHRHARVKVSHGGEIKRSSQGGELKYIGGETKLVKFARSVSLREFHDRLAVIAGCFDIAVRYVRPHETLDELRDVVSYDDLLELLDWALLRDLKIRLPGAKSSNELVPHVRVIVARVDVRPPLPEALFSSASTTNSDTPVASPSCLTKRSESAPLLSANPADDASKPPSPSVIQRSASASTITQPSITTAAASQGVHVHNAAPFPAVHRGPVGTAPVFLVPVMPVIVYQPMIPVYGVPVVRRPSRVSQRGSPVSCSK